MSSAVTFVFFFFFNDTATTEIYTLSLTTLFRSMCALVSCASSCSSSAIARSSFSQAVPASSRSEEHTSELQSLTNLVCRLLLEKKNINLFYNGATNEHAKLQCNYTHTGLSGVTS